MIQELPLTLLNTFVLARLVLQEQKRRVGSPGGPGLDAGGPLRRRPGARRSSPSLCQVLAQGRVGHDLRIPRKLCLT